MTTGAIITAVGVEMGHAGVDPAANTTGSMTSAVRARILNAINRRYRRLLSIPGAQGLREGTTTVNSADGTALYNAGSVAKIHRIWETTNDRLLLPMTIDQYRAIDPDPSDNKGTSTHWIDAGYDSSRRPQFYLWPTPNEIIAYTLDVLNAITDLSLDADIPLVPADFHDILVIAGLIEEYRKKDDTRAAYLETELMQREKHLLYWLAESASGATDLMMEPPSSLGPWYPSGS